MKYNFDEIKDRFEDYSAKYSEIEVKYGSKELLPMWIADMDFKVAQPIIDAIKKRADIGIFGYTTRPEVYNQAIVDWVKKRHEWEIDKKWLMFSPGVIPAISMIIQSLTEVGDKIIIQQPVYSPFSSVVRDNGRELVVNPLKKEASGNYVMDFEDLEKKIDDKTKFIILCNPHNPVGRVWTKDELKKLGDICIKNSVKVISDEIHCDLTFSDKKHIPFASISKEFRDISITCLAPSKTFNIPGLQASVIVIPNKEEFNLVNQAFSNIDIKRNNCFSLVATHAAYIEGEEWLDQVMEYIEKNVDFAVDFINNNIPKLKVIKPEGTFLLWIDFSKLNLDSDKLRYLMINDAKLALSDGIGFGTGGDCYQRMNIACPKSILKDALNRLKVTIEKLEQH